jgi:serine/threonine-protein kinase RsbW
MNQTWPALVGSVAPIRHGVVAWAAHAGATDRALDDVALAVSEAVTNCCVHAFIHAPQPGSITVLASVISETHVRIVITDDGSGLNPRSDSPGVGLGLALIAQLSNDLVIGDAPGGGTVVQMDLPLTRAG